MTPDDFSEVHRNFNKTAKSNANTLIFAKSPLGSVKNGVKNGVKFENGDTILQASSYLESFSHTVMAGTILVLLG